MFCNNCTNVTNNALEAGGLETGSTSNHAKGDTPILGRWTIDTKNISPSTKQKEIEKRNKGERADDILTPIR